MTKNIAFTIVFILFLSGCKTSPKEEIILSANQYYSDGVSLMEDGKYEKAADSFSKIYFQHPGSSLSSQAELMEAYSLFLDNQYEEADDVLDIFIMLHPTNPDIDYAYYLKALAYYMQISNINHDQTKTYLAKNAFEKIIEQYPNTKYAIDAELKLDLVNDHLAGADMNIGRYYLALNNPIAASDRFLTVIDKYPQTVHVKEAFYRMVEVYMLLGIKDEAIKYAAILGHNHPTDIWYHRSYNMLNN